MKNIKCRNCAGTMYLDASGMTAVCPFCGSTNVLDHKDTDYYKSFYRQMGEFLSGSDDDRARQLRADALWDKADHAEFDCTDGSTIEIRYLYSDTFSGGEMFVARRNIVFRFSDMNAPEPEQFRKAVSLLDYPSADTRQLARFFPNISGGFRLHDGSSLLVIKKDIEEYPLSLFGKLDGRHVAWIISRMENLCCVLEYNSLVHPQLSADTLFINPFTHQAALYGGWWLAVKNNSFSRDRSRICTTKENLIGLRNTAARLLGFSRTGDVKAGPDIPKALADFINSAPKSNAYEDFAYWDEMLIKAYGERKFTKFTTDDKQVYGG